MKKAPVSPGLSLPHCFNYSGLTLGICQMDVVESEELDLGRA
jgi:hypothetical protein